MNNRRNADLFQQLTLEIAVFSKQLEDILLLTYLREQLEAAKASQRKIKDDYSTYCKDTKIDDPNDPEFLLRESQTGKEYQRDMSYYDVSIERLTFNIEKCKQLHNARMAPLLDLYTYVSEDFGNLDKAAAMKFYDSACVLNQEGSLQDRLACIGAILKSLFSLQFKDAAVTWRQQKEKNKIRKTMAGIFKHPAVKDIAGRKDGGVLVRRRSKV